MVPAFTLYTNRSGPHRHEISGRDRGALPAVSGDGARASPTHQRTRQADQDRARRLAVAHSALLPCWGPSSYRMRTQAARPCESQADRRKGSPPGCSGMRRLSGKKRSAGRRARIRHRDWWPVDVSHGDEGPTRPYRRRERSAVLTAPSNVGAAQSLRHAFKGKTPRGILVSAVSSGADGPRRIRRTTRRTGGGRQARRPRRWSRSPKP
jgi:hypothetical protein